MYQYKLNSVLKVVDGDTVDVSIDLGFSVTTIQRIRLAGVDTPETNTKDELERTIGNEAKQFVVDWVSKQNQMIIKTTKDDKYGRMLGEIFGDDGQTINQLLLEKGYAWAYDGNTKNKDLTYLIEKRKNNG
jgi:micrococcal nuclease